LDYRFAQVMVSSISDPRRIRDTSSIARLFFLAVCTGLLLNGVHADSGGGFREDWQADFMFHSRVTSLSRRGPPSNWNGRIPLAITNQCDTTIWPGVATQAGTGPGIGGFELVSGNSSQLWVSPDWQGRVWGRTNCTVNGESCSCDTGDCFGKLDCEFSGATPATLAEFNLAGGENGQQTFYDLSLVDGYNLPIALKYIPAKNTTFIPPNLTNCACIATPGWLYAQNDTGTYYSNSSYPIPLEASETNGSVRRWCPWPLLAFPPTKPGDGVFPYPDDNIERPLFAPCNSACAASGRDKDCCVGQYHDPEKCQPSRYSKAVKAVCPDAYSYAFDDQKSTFIIPKGGGWEIVFCPAGRSTNILRQLGQEMFDLATSGHLSSASLANLRNVTYIVSDKGAGATLRPTLMAVSVMAGAIAVWIGV
jgi:hypothetical protein